MNDDQVRALVEESVARALAKKDEEIAAAISDALRTYADRPVGEKGSPSLQFGVVEDVVDTYAYVTLDGQTDAVPINMLGGLVIGERVAVLLLPPSGNLAIGMVTPTVVPSGVNYWERTADDLHLDPTNNAGLQTFTFDYTDTPGNRYKILANTGDLTLENRVTGAVGDVNLDASSGNANGLVEAKVTDSGFTSDAFVSAQANASFADTEIEARDGHGHTAKVEVISDNAASPRTSAGITANIVTITADGAGGIVGADNDNGGVFFANASGGGGDGGVFFDCWGATSPGVHGGFYVTDHDAGGIFLTSDQPGGSVNLLSSTGGIDLEALGGLVSILGDEIVFKGAGDPTAQLASNSDFGFYLHPTTGVLTVKGMVSGAVKTLVIGTLT